MRLKYVVWLGLGLYVLLSATDWAFTFALLHGYPGAVETNPLAAACLARFGWGGLALYKATGVLVFVGAVLLLVRRRPILAAKLTGGACAVMLAVLVYTHGLLCEAHRDAVDRAQDAAWAQPKKGHSEPPVTGPGRCWFAQDPVLVQAAVPSK